MGSKDVIKSMPVSRQYRDNFPVTFRKGKNDKLVIKKQNDFKTVIVVNTDANFGG
jgi:hypothetical protein